MAISSGHSNLKRFSRPYEYFDVGDPFLYSPLNKPEVTVLIEAEPTSSIPVSEYCKKCALTQWCTDKENLTPDGFYTPACTAWGRESGDNQYVYFRLA